MQTTGDFAEAYQTYWAPATGLARSLTRDHAAAEDIAADGLLRVWRQWEDGRIRQPWGYVRRTIFNETISRARKTAREQAATDRYRPPPDDDHEESVADRDLVVRLLAELPPAQRRVIELRYLEDLSEQETARRLGISVGAVKSGSSRALARLRNAHTLDAAI